MKCRLYRPGFIVSLCLIFSLGARRVGALPAQGKAYYCQGRLERIGRFVFRTLISIMPSTDFENERRLNAHQKFETEMDRMFPEVDPAILQAAINEYRNDRVVRDPTARWVEANGRVSIREMARDRDLRKSIFYPALTAYLIEQRIINSSDDKSEVDETEAIEATTRGLIRMYDGMVLVGIPDIHRYRDDHLGSPIDAIARAFEIASNSNDKSGFVLRALSQLGFGSSFRTVQLAETILTFRGLRPARHDWQQY